MYEPVKSEVNNFLDKAKRERENRKLEILKHKAAVIIQKWYRGYICRKNIRFWLLKDFSEIIREDELLDNKTLLRAIRCLRFKFNITTDTKNFEVLARQLVLSIDSCKSSHSFISFVLKKDTIAEWIRVSNWILRVSLAILTKVEPSLQQDARTMNVVLTLVINILSVSRWKMTAAMKNETLNTQMSKITDTLYNKLLKDGMYQKLKILLLKGVCRQNISFSQISLNGIMNIILRLFNGVSIQDNFLLSFISNILSVPSIIKHMNIMANEMFQTILKDRICTRIIVFLNKHEGNQLKLFEQLQPSYSLCIIANIIDLGLLEMDVLANHGSEFCTVLSNLLVKLNHSIHMTVSSSSHYHQIFGWSAVSMDENIQGSVGYLRSQLRLLWSSKMIRSMFDELYDQPLLDSSSSSTGNKNSSGNTGKHESNKRFGGGGGPLFKLPRLAASSSFWKKLQHLGSSAGKLTAGTNSASSLQPNQNAVSSSIALIPLSIQSVCMLYFFTTSCLSQIRDDILAGVSLTDLPARMWRLIKSSGTVKQWAQVVKEPDSGWYSDPHPSHLLHIFVLIAKNLFIILDDVEVFEKEKVFSVTELREMCDFFNKLFVEVVMMMANELELMRLTQGRDIVPGNATASIQHDSRRNQEAVTLFVNCYRLLLVLYDRDIRHQFTPDGFWLIKSMKVSHFLSDLAKDKYVPRFLLVHVPHIIPHKDRVVLFREKIKTEKVSLGLVSRNWSPDDGPIGAVISVRRSRIVEDGFEQLMKVVPENWKRKIRVRFINELGMDELGIDLDGVFKEFLEESVRRLLDPGLGLMCATSEHRLYPSPLSGVCGERHHLLLLQYLGRLLGKAVYEGLLLEAPFAHFFLTQLLGRSSSSSCHEVSQTQQAQSQHYGLAIAGGTGTALYSFLDELRTFDKELYQSLCYVKHYDGDISDLELSFSYDEDRLGFVETHDLCPGGRYITVTNDNRISYVHTVARFRMYVQIREQTRAFITGFYSLVRRDWLDLFSAPELLKLICGDTGNIDIDDLKGNVKYSGGFHSGHRVVVWLWDVLKHDFSEQERGLFLKFVTSCSKPPLLGFSNLNPPFSIRCVHSADTEETEETVGSMLRHLFSLPSLVGGGGGGGGSSGASHSTRNGHHSSNSSGVTGGGGGGSGSSSHVTKRRAGDPVIARLPSAATCFNLLKLPNYDTKSILRDKLRYVIHCGAGFELS